MQRGEKSNPSSNNIGKNNSQALIITHSVAIFRKLKSRQAVAIGQLHTALKFCYSHGKLGCDEGSPTRDSFCSHCQDVKDFNQRN